LLTVVYYELCSQQFLNDTINYAHNYSTLALCSDVHVIAIN